MNYLELIGTILGTDILAVVITHFLTKRKYKVEVEKLSTEVKSDTIENMDKSLDFYEKWVENTNKRLDEVINNQDRLITENASLRTELNTVKEQTTRMSTLLCTNLPCGQRVQDASVLECIYMTNNKTLKHRNNKKCNKKATNNKVTSN